MLWTHTHTHKQQHTYMWANLSKILEQFKSEHAKWFDRKWNKSFLLFPFSSFFSPPSFSLFNSTLSFERAPALFSRVSRLTCTPQIRKCLASTQYKRIEENQTRNLSIWLESHTLICLNDLFSFCHFSLGRVRGTNEWMYDVRCVFSISVSFTTGIHMDFNWALERIEENDFSLLLCRG